MLFKSLVLLSVLSLSWARFGQEHPQVLTDLANACPGGTCQTLAGNAVSTLLAGAGECTQQDFADSIINAAQQFDDTTKQNMISLAKTFRQAEKNTPPDFTTNPPTNRNSVFCQKAPANAELNGLVQAQDPANNPNVFFDPAEKVSVQKGAQANTFPFGTAPAGLSKRRRARRAASGNLQTFTGALGGITPPAVTAIANPTDGKAFQVDGNASFNNLQNALVRSCDVQHNKCANAANAQGNKGAFSVQDCQTQQDACDAQAKAQN